MKAAILSGGKSYGKAFWTSLCCFRKEGPLPTVRFGMTRLPFPAEWHCGRDRSPHLNAHVLL